MHCFVEGVAMSVCKLRVWRWVCARWDCGWKNVKWKRKKHKRQDNPQILFFCFISHESDSFLPLEKENWGTNFLYSYWFEGCQQKRNYQGGSTSPIIIGFGVVCQVLFPLQGRWCTMTAHRAGVVRQLPFKGYKTDIPLQGLWQWLYNRYKGDGISVKWYTFTLRRWKYISQVKVYHLIYHCRKQKR